MNDQRPSGSNARMLPTTRKRRRPHVQVDVSLDLRVVFDDGVGIHPSFPVHVHFVQYHIHVGQPAPSILMSLLRRLVFDN